MRSYRDGKEVLICDGCHKEILDGINVPGYYAVHTRDYRPNGTVHAHKPKRYPRSGKPTACAIKVLEQEERNLATQGAAYQERLELRTLSQVPPPSPPPVEA